MIPMAVLVILFLSGANGLASHRMNSKLKLSSRHQNQYPLTSLPLSYAIDSTRMGNNIHASIPKNMTLPLILPKEEILPPTQPSPGNGRRNNLLKRIMQKVKGGSIAKMGIDFGLTYNMISNINGSVTLSTAWYIASMKVRHEREKGRFD